MNQDTTTASTGSTVGLQEDEGPVSEDSNISVGACVHVRDGQLQTNVRGPEGRGEQEP